MEKFTLVVPDDQWILMAHLEFEISSDVGGEFRCGEDCGPDDWCSAAASTSGMPHVFRKSMLFSLAYSSTLNTR